MDRYLAGIFDGEGNICITVHDTQVKLIVSVEMTCLEIVEMFRSEFGGNIYSRPGRPHADRVMYAWKMYGGNCLNFLRYVEENCVLKKQEATVAMRLAEKLSSHPARIKLTDQERQERILIFRDHRATQINKRAPNEEVVRRFLSA